MDFSLSKIAKGFGMLVGETVHQLDEAYEGTKNIGEACIEDIKKVPDAVMQGYDEELFTPKQVEGAKEKVKEVVNSAVETTKEKIEEITVIIDENSNVTEEKFIFVREEETTPPNAQ